jgi:Fe-S cluster biogenesis protein NfuA
MAVFAGRLCFKAEITGKNSPGTRKENCTSLRLARAQRNRGVSNAMKCWKVLAVLVLLAIAAPATALAGGANQIVRSSATADNPIVVRSATQWAPFGGPTANSANIALATSTDCTGCRAVAVAFQAIILTNAPNVVTPANVAVAANGSCDGCDSFAFAYQDVITTDGSATLSATGIALVREIDARADAIARSGVPDSQMEAELKDLALEFKADVEQNLVMHGPASVSDSTDVQAG